VLDDSVSDHNRVKRVVLLSGKIYYDLVKERQARGLDNAIAFVRIEELSPFPFRHLGDVLGQYKGANVEICYFQEEPRNQGTYEHVASRIRKVLEDLEIGYGRKLQYLGRKESAVPAPGVGKLYVRQQKEIIESAFVGLHAEAF
jgi:probable 2-oxoglutarate dehydrogenase E1 component DHKTD1